ncbi:MAG: pilus assembly protein TadG-related protein [Acidimicrobiales bacterium]
MRDRSALIRRDRGQLVPIFALSLVLIITLVGLVIDGGNAWSQRRQAQNAADLAALAGTRSIAINMADMAQLPPVPPTATDADVKAAVERVLLANGISSPTAGANYTANYVDAAFNVLPGYGLGGPIPPTAVGLQVGTSKAFRPYFLGVIGINSWTAAATALARAGWYAGSVGSPGGNLVPIAVQLSTLPKGANQNLLVCPTGDPPGASPPTCVPIQMTSPTSGSLLPGQFAWMSWSGSTSTKYTCGVGQTPGGILGPPANSPAYPQIPPDSYITIPGNTGVANSCSSNIQAWVTLGATVLVPIISPGTGNFPGTSIPYPPATQGGPGNSTQYNIIGFAGFQITGCGQPFGVANGPCINNLYGVFRNAFFAGPSGSTSGTNGVPGGMYGVQLVQ